MEGRGKRLSDEEKGILQMQLSLLLIKISKEIPALQQIIPEIKEWNFLDLNIRRVASICHNTLSSNSVLNESELLSLPHLLVRELLTSRLETQGEDLWWDTC